MGRLGELGRPKWNPVPRRMLVLAVASVMLVAGVASVATLGWGPFARSGAPTPTGPGVRINVGPASITPIVHEPSGLVAGDMSAQFYTIHSDILATMSPMTTSVSLQIYAKLNVVRDGIDRVYTHLNDLPYNPRAPPPLFSANVTFASQPAFCVPATAPSPATTS